jgi:hypothetical protein
MRTLVVGDVHGCAAELERLIALAAADRVVSVGDLFTKGPDPSAVWDLVQEHRIDAVLGNHEQRLLDVVDGVRPNDGGAEKCIAKLYRGDRGWLAWVRALPLYREVGGWTVVHAAVESDGAEVTPKSVAIYRRRIGGDDGPLWWEVYTGAAPVVYGHDAIRGLVRVERGGKPWVIGLDSGCVYGRCLSGYLLEEDKILQVPAARVYKPIHGRAA